jgi:iron complex outermembrane receptor protein
VIIRIGTCAKYSQPSLFDPRAFDDYFVHCRTNTLFWGALAVEYSAMPRKIRAFWVVSRLCAQIALVHFLGEGICVMIHLRLRRAFTIICVVLIAGSAFVSAQSAPGSVEGRVSDSQQLALSQTVVEVFERSQPGPQAEQDRPIQKVVADEGGHYKIGSLPPGSYTLRFSHLGFEPAREGPVTVASQRTTLLDVILKPQQVRESVTVVAENDRLVASMTDIPLKDLPVTVQTVSRELIKQQDATDIVTALNNVPGADAFTAYGTYNYFIFRGFGFDNINGSAMLLNGLPIEGNRINSEINSVESVEVLKGPASMLYGTQAPGGTMNITEKKPISTPAYDVVLHGGRWGTGGVEFGATGPIRGDGLLYRVDTAYIHSDGFRGAGYDRFNVTPSLFWRIRPGDTLDIHVTSNIDRYDLDAGIPLLNTPQNAYNPFLANIVPNIPLSRRFNTPGGFQKTRDFINQAFYEHFFTENVRIREAFQYRWLDDHYFQSESLFVDPLNNPTQVQRSNFYFFNHDRQLLDQSDFLADFKLLWSHQFLAGYEYYQYERPRDRSSAAQNAPEPNIDLYNPVETAVPITSFPVSAVQYFRNRSNAVFFQDYVRILPKLELLVGGRYDGFRHIDSFSPVVNGVETPGAVTHIIQNPFTYRVALNAQVLPFMSIYTNYGTSFVAQTELSTAGNQLKPQSGSEFEVGDRFNFFKDRLTLDTAVYHMVEKNVAVARSNGVIDQAGEQHSKGIEAELRGRLSQRLNFFANYGFTNAAYDEFVSQDGDGSFVEVRGHVPSFVARHTARLWTTYDFPKGIGVSLGGRYLSKRPTDQFNHVFMGGFTTWDTGFYYRRPRMEYDLFITNFLDKSHYFISAINDTQLYPGPPIGVSGAVRFHF